MTWICLVIKGPSINNKVGGSGEHKVAGVRGGFPSLVGVMAVPVTESLSASTRSSSSLLLVGRCLYSTCHPTKRRRVLPNVRALSPLCYSDFIFYAGQLHVLSIQRQI